MLKSGSTRLVSQIFSSAARHVTVTFLNFVSPPLRANFLPPRQSLKGGLQSQLLRFSFWRGRKYDRYIAVIHSRYSSAFWRRVQSLRPARGAESRVYGSPGGEGLESPIIYTVSSSPRLAVPPSRYNFRRMFCDFVTPDRASTFNCTAVCMFRNIAVVRVALEPLGLRLEQALGV